VLLTLDVGVPGVDNNVLVAGGTEDIYRGMFELCSVSAPFEMGCIGGGILTDQPAALAELYQMVTGAVGCLACPGGQ